MMKNLIGYEGLMYYMDGNQIAIVESDFVDLQESPAIFLECPFCGSGDIIPPAEKYSKFTCDSCGRDFEPDLLGLLKGGEKL